MSMAARNAASISKCVVSSKCASGGGLAAGRPRGWCRARRGAGCRPGPSASSTGSPAACSSAARRRARTSGVAVDEDLHVGIGEDDRADVAAVEHRAGRRAAEIALERQQRGAHLRDCRDDRGRLADRVAFERRFVEARRIERLRAAATARVTSSSAMPGIEQRLGHRPVDQPGIEMPQPDNARRAACRACPCRRRPVRRWR